MRNKEKSINFSKGKPLPFGVSRYEDKLNFSVPVPMPVVSECILNLYKKGEADIWKSIKMGREYRTGNVFSVSIESLPYSDVEYMYETNGIEWIDPYAKSVTGRYKFGKVLDDKQKKKIRGALLFDNFDWGSDTKLQIPYEEMILYKLHVRGFTKHISSKVKKRGTYEGIIEKIPYFKELGINSILIMPIMEFDEIMPKEDVFSNQGYDLRFEKLEEEQPYKVNYWGYSDSPDYFAPKASYAADPFNPVDEIKRMVKALHENGIEVILEFYFAPKMNQNMIIECLRYWVLEYHIDGFKINPEVVPAELAATDVILCDIKLLATDWNPDSIYGNNYSPEYRNLAEYNDGFLFDLRKYLKSDEGQVNEVVGRIRKNPVKTAVINYITNHNGFTLMDLYSFDVKHNNVNGESNRDGTEYNFSWNCGFEGKTRRKKIVDLRKKQIKNAMICLLLSQGVPMILSGDEFGNSQMGNNNAYCQDNEISWLNWNNIKTNNEIFEFIKNLISFRKIHPIFHNKEELKGIDYISCGCPDFSVHGTKAWYPDYSNYSRVLGIMLCGEYALLDRKNCDDYFYIAFNMHWEEHKFSLPKLPDNKKWWIVIDTTEEKVRLAEENQGYIEEQKEYNVKARSIVVFIGR